MSKIIVVGGLVSEAQDYCKKNGLDAAKAVIIYKPESLRTVRGATVHVVGGFWKRHDRTDFTREFAARGCTVEDFTGGHL